jgi:hypothetical protein
MPIERQRLRSDSGVSLLKVILTGRGSRKPVEISYEVEMEGAIPPRAFGNMLDADLFFHSQLSHGPHEAQA